MLIHLLTICYILGILKETMIKHMTVFKKFKTKEQTNEKEHEMQKWKVQVQTGVSKIYLSRRASMFLIIIYPEMPREVDYTWKIFLVPMKMLKVETPTN